MNDVPDISPLFETPQPPRERDLTKDVEHKELNPVEEVQVDTLVSKQLVQTDKEVLHSRRHERLKRDQIVTEYRLATGRLIRRCTSSSRVAKTSGILPPFILGMMES